MIWFVTGLVIGVILGGMAMSLASISKINDIDEFHRMREKELVKMLEDKYGSTRDMHSI